LLKWCSVFTIEATVHRDEAAITAGESVWDEFKAEGLRLFAADKALQPAPGVHGKTSSALRQHPS
jgi:hypothetical protein